MSSSTWNVTNAKRILLKTRKPFSWRTLSDGIVPKHSGNVSGCFRRSIINFEEKNTSEMFQFLPLVLHFLVSMAPLTIHGRLAELIVVVIAELILQPFRHFTHVTAHFPTLPSLYLRHSSFSNPFVALPTSQLILQPFVRFSYVKGSLLMSPGEPPMHISNDSYKIFAKYCGRHWQEQGSDSFFIVTSAVLHSFLLPNPTLLKSLPVSWKRSEQVAVSSYSS